MSAWEDWLDRLKDDSGKLAKDELKNLVSDAKADSEEFIQRQGEKLEIYLNQLAMGLITKEQFEGYVGDIRDLSVMQTLKMKVEARARAQSLANGITKLIIDRLLALI